MSAGGTIDADSRDHRSRLQLLRSALAEELCDIEVYKIGVMKNNRFDRALDLVALMAVCGYDVQHFAGNSVLVRERDAAEWMPNLLPEFSLDHIPQRVLIILQGFANIGQERTGNEIVALNGNAAAERFLEHVGDGDALPSAGIQMLDEGHVDVAGQQGELYRSQLGEGPALAAAARSDSLAPHHGDLFAQRLVLDLPDAGKKLRDLSDSVDGCFVCFHGGYLDFSRYL